MFHYYLNDKENPKVALKDEQWAVCTDYER